MNWKSSKDHSGFLSQKQNFNPPLHKLVQFNVLDRGKIKYKHKRIQIIKIQSFSFLQNKNVIEITLLVELFNIWRNHIETNSTRHAKRKGGKKN